MNDTLRNVFKNRSVFLTGHTGFKGSWLTLWLSGLGARVTGYSLKPPTQPSNFELSGIRERLVAHHEKDIRDHTALRAALGACKPEIVFHLAAQPVVRESYWNPIETFDVNVMGAVALLDGIRALRLRCAVVIVTSDKCYEIKPGAPAPGTIGAWLCARI